MIGMRIECGVVWCTSADDLLRAGARKRTDHELQNCILKSFKKCIPLLRYSNMIIIIIISRAWVFNPLEKFVVLWDYFANDNYILYRTTV